MRFFTIHSPSDFPLHSRTALRRGLLFSGSAGLALGIAPAGAQQARPSGRLSSSAPSLAPLTLPSPARVALQRAQQLEKQGIISLAAVQFRAAVAAAPDSLETNRALADFYSHQERWEEASEAWRRVLLLKRGAPDREATSQLARAQSAMLRNSDALPVGAGQSRVSLNNSPTIAFKDDFAASTAALTVTSSMTSTRGSAQTLPRLAQIPASPTSPSAQNPTFNPTTGILDAPTAPDLSAPGLPNLDATSTAPSIVMPQPLAPQRVSRPQALSLSPSRSAVQAPLSALAPATNVSALPFRSPTRVRPRVSRFNAAKAWPLVNRAATELAAGRTQNALRLYQSAYKIDPTNAYAGPGIGTSNIVLGRFSAAATAFRAFLAIKPGDAKALRGLADALTFGQKYREALGVNNVLLARQPRDFAASYQNAQIATYLRSYTLADRFFNTALAVQPSNGTAWTAWGESLSYRRDPRAVDRFQRALSFNFNSVRALTGLGDYYSYVGQFSLAIPRYRAALSAKPGEVKTMTSLADALTYSGQTLAAVPLYRAALQKQPSNRTAQLGLGRALVYSGNSEAGVAQLRRVLAVEPGNYAALEALALGQTDFDPTSAITSYRRILGSQTSGAARAKTLASIGDLQARAAQFPAALQSYAQASALAPSDAKIGLSYAQLLAAQEQFETARPVVEGVLGRFPNNAQALALQVQIENQTGNTARAQELATRLETVTPASADEALSLAEALRATGNAASAKRVLDRAVVTVSDPVTALRIADATRDAGDYATASSLYNRVLTSNPRDVAARLSLAESLIYQRDLVGARAQVQRVLALDPANVQAKVLGATIELRADTPAGREAAIRDANEILRNDPTNVGAIVIVGEVLTSRQQFAAAVAQFRSAVQAEPGNLEARLGLARNLNYSRDTEASITQYREVIRRLPTDTLPRLELAQIYLDRNRFSDAEALFNEVLALRRGLPLSATARWNVETRASARLNPLARLGSPLRPKGTSKAQVAAKMRSRRVVTDAPGRVVPTGAPTGGTPTNRLRILLAQNAVPGSGSTVSAPSSAGAVPGVPNVSTPSSAGGAAPGATGASALPAPSFGSASPLGAVPITPPVPDLGAPLPVPGSSVPAFGDFGVAAGVESPLADQSAALRGLGEIRRRQERFSEALEFFNQAVTLDPNDGAARVGAAQALRGQTKYAEALAQTNQVLAADATNLPARVLRAQLLGDSGQPAQAQQELDALVASLPENAPLETYVTLTQAFNTLQNYPASLQLLDEATRLYPSEPAVPRLRAETLTFARRNDEAVTIYNQLIAADPQDADAVVGKARVYNYSDQLALAETTYRQALGIQPANYQATTELADVLGRRANFPASIALYQTAIGTNPTDLATRVELARVQRFAGQSADAEVTLNQVLDADNRYVSALVERGTLRGTQGSFAPALADLGAALEISPTDLGAQISLAEVQSYAGNYEESIRGFRAVLVRDPQNRLARTQLGSTLGLAGQTDAALRELNAVLVASPTDTGARIAKAEVLGRANRTAESVALFDQILSAEPQNSRARTGLADAYLNARQYNNAIGVYDALLTTDPGNSTFRIQRARALGYAGRAREAVSALRAVVAADPTNVPARLALAEAGTNSGNRALLGDAVAEYRQILQADPSNVSAQIGLGRALSYRGNYRESQQILNTVLTASPTNTEARYALAESQRFQGASFDAAQGYRSVLAAQPGSAGATAGLATVRRDIAPRLSVSGSYYSDTNGVRLRSLNYGATLPTRAGTIGVIANRGRFTQGATERNRDALSLLLGKAFGPVQARLVLTRLKYDGAPNRTLFDLLLNTARGPRERYFFNVAKRDIFESDVAVVQGITATLYRAGFTYPLGNRVDLEGQLTRYRYSDDNSRTTLQPSIFYRLKPTNPSLRVGLGYIYDNTRELRNGPPFVYFTPRGFNATSVLADYVVDQGRTRYGLFAAYPLTDETGEDGLNRPAKTLFGSINHDLSDALELFAEGGLVRTPTFRSNQISSGVNLRF